jgi:hypothetical protein
VTSGQDVIRRSSDPKRSAKHLAAANLEHPPKRGLTFKRPRRMAIHIPVHPSRSTRIRGHRERSGNCRLLRCQNQKAGVRRGGETFERGKGIWCRIGRAMSGRLNRPCRIRSRRLHIVVASLDNPCTRFGLTQEAERDQRPRNLIYRMTTSMTSIQLKASKPFRSSSVPSLPSSLYTIPHCLA